MFSLTWPSLRVKLSNDFTLASFPVPSRLIALSGMQSILDNHPSTVYLQQGKPQLSQNKSGVLHR